jgi:23S rRNA pseudouridine1911/1915/1917 synthase
MMELPPLDPFPISADEDGVTLAGLLRKRFPDLSWSRVRRLIDTRHVRIGGEVCRDPARRVHEGETVELLHQSAAPPRRKEAVALRHLDEHVVVVEKPSGLSTVRHPQERDWDRQRKALSPTLEDIVPALIAREERRRHKGPQLRLRIVQRLDKETSGLVVFARTVLAERVLGKQFHAHTVMRRYLAVVPGLVPSQRIATRLVRNRGDGRRGSTSHPELGKEAVTHIEVVERLPGFTLLGCRLETGRTHQIRIHLAELGHPVCGEKVYNHQLDISVLPDASAAPRLALHATELGFVHPATNEDLHWTMPLPPDLQALVERLRGGLPGDRTRRPS